MFGKFWQQYPNREGTYLAACVFYVVIYREKPEGLDYYGKVEKNFALELQKIAADTVLINSGQWNLP